MFRKIALGLLGLLVIGAMVMLLGANSYERIVDKNIYAAKNFDFIGYHDLNGKATFKMALHQKGEKWYLFCAHFTAKGWSILDVTDPSKPKLVKFLKNPEKNTNNGQIQIANNLMITALERPLTELTDIMPWQGYAWLFREAVKGKLPYKPWKYTPNGILIWDVKDQEKYKKMPLIPKLFGAFKADTWKAEYTEGIYRKSDLVVEGRCGFDACEGSNLEEIIAAAKVQNLLFCGFTTEHCVEMTMNTLSQKGYDCILVADCTATKSQRLQTKVENRQKTIISTAVFTNRLIRLW